MAADDPALAEKLLQSAVAWQAYSNPELKTEWKKAQSEIAAGKKVLRFRKN